MIVYVQTVLLVVFLSLTSAYPTPSSQGLYGYGPGYLTKRAAHGHGHGYGHGHYGGHYGGYHHGKRSASKDDPSDHIFISEGHLWNLEDYHQ